MRWFSLATVSLIAWGVLAFGAEYPWAYAPLFVFASTIGVLGLAAPDGPRTESRAPVVALGLLLAAIGAQLVPLPAAAVEALSPARSVEDWPALVRATVPGVPSPAATGPEPLSIAPARTLLGGACLAALALFFLGCRRGLGVVRASTVVRGVTALGLLVGLVAIAQEASGSPLAYGLWWPRKVESLPAAPFINENHLAGWLAMAFALAAGHLAGDLAGGGFAARAGWRPRIRWLASRAGSTAVLVGLCLFVMAVAVLFTGSVSGALALLVVCWAFSRRLTGPGRRLARTVLTALPLAALAWVGFAAVGTEVAAASWSDLGGRVPIWRDTVRMVGDFPLTGAGWNTYGIAMLAYQTIRPQVHVVEAHNDYLQLAAEGGLLVGLPVLIALVVFVREVRARFRQTEDDPRIHWLRVGAVAGLIALLTQSLVDFSLQMPGNAVLFALLAAIAVHRPPPAPARAEGTTPCG